jgi:ribose transport system permease protein
MDKNNRRIKISEMLDHLKKNVSVGSVVIALVGLGVIWTFMTPYFLTIANLKNLSLYIAANGVMAAGLTIAMITGSIDLSQIALMALCGMIVGISTQNGIGGLPLVLIAIIPGIIGGIVNAVSVCILGINPFIATLGGQLLFRSLAFISTDGVYISVQDHLIRSIARDEFLGLPIMLWILVIIYAIFWFILKYTQFGRNVYSTGGNSVAAYLSGINIKKIRFIAFMFAGGCSGLASLLYIAQGRVALNNAGTGAEMDIMAGVILGGISFAGGSCSVINSLLGITLLGVIANGMSLLGITPYFQMLIKGMVLLIAVFLDTLRRKNTVL